MPHAFDDVDGDTRINIMIYERGPERRTRVYLPGPHVDPARIAGVCSRDVVVTAIVAPPLPIAGRSS